MTTTTATITAKQIRTLRAEAAASGDDAQVDLCDLATGTGPVVIDASGKEYDESDNCLALAVEQYVERYPDLAGYDLSPTWRDDSRETIRLTIPQWHRDSARAKCAEAAWWAWHDQDSSRASATMEEAEERCAAWVAGTSDDGPDRTHA